MFENDLERWEAWEERREEMMAGCLRPPLVPGRRPEAWWRLDRSPGESNSGSYRLAAGVDVCSP
jgi:hypothetical protein